MSGVKLKRFIKTGIKLLSRVSKNPNRVFKVLRSFLKSNPWFLVMLVFVLKIGKYIQSITENDSIFLYNILCLIRQITNSNIQLEYSLLPLANTYQEPRVIGIIPDGNRRWARSLPEQNLTPSHGHFFGAYKISNMIRWSIIDNRISHLVVYLLSYDNYRKRSKEEQSSIISLLQSWVSEFEMLNHSNQADIAILGEPDEIFREALGGLPINPEKRDMTKTRVSLLLCYDGRREIHQSGGDPSKMWLQEDIDVVIRTGFTQRASGFCTYQTGYSEWFYPGVYWPEFNVQTFKNLLDESYKVQRNFGV